MVHIFTVIIILLFLPANISGGYFQTYFDPQGMTALHWAAFHGRTGHVKLLVGKKADPLSRDTDGKLPLHWAAQVLYFKVNDCNILFWQFSIKLLY